MWYTTRNTERGLPQRALGPRSPPLRSAVILRASSPEGAIGVPHVTPGPCKRVASAILPTLGICRVSALTPREPGWSARPLSADGDHSRLLSLDKVEGPR